MSLSPPYPVEGLYKAFEARIQMTSWARTVDNSDCIYTNHELRNLVTMPGEHLYRLMGNGLTQSTSNRRCTQHSPVIVTLITFKYPWSSGRRTWKYPYIHLHNRRIGWPVQKCSSRPDLIFHVFWQAWNGICIGLTMWHAVYVSTWCEYGGSAYTRSDCGAQR
jgi:hypothetical protein